MLWKVCKSVNRSSSVCYNNESHGAALLPHARRLLRLGYAVGGILLCGDSSGSESSLAARTLGRTRAVTA